MSEPSANSSTRYPTPGCLLLAFGGMWVVLLGGYMFWKMRQQVAELRAFTDKSAMVVTPAQPTGEQITALRTRISAFGDAIERKEKASLTLSVTDLNALIATVEGPKAMRDSAIVESIADTVKLTVSLALNGPPFSGERYFLNGTMDVRPGINAAKGISLQTKAIQVPNKTPSEGFVRLYLEANHLDGLLLDTVRDNPANGISQVLRKLTTVRLENGTVILDYIPPS